MWHRKARRHFHFNFDACVTVCHVRVITCSLAAWRGGAWGVGRTLLELLEAESGFSSGWRTNSEVEDTGREGSGIPPPGESTVGGV